MQQSLQFEEQHVTQYESIIDPDQSWLEQWLMHELKGVYNYHGCATQESNPRIRALWERFLEYEVGHLHHVMALYKQHVHRNPMEFLPESLPEPIPFASQRGVVRRVFLDEVDLRTNGAECVSADQEGRASVIYRDHINRDGSPSEAIASGYSWNPGTELAPKYQPEENDHV